MNEVKLDSFLNDLADCNSVILPVAEKVMERANKEYGVKKEDVGFELKDYTQIDADVKPKREAVVTINTIAKDRDGEAVLPEGAILDDYELLKVVLFGHNYAGLGVGKNLWLKIDPHLFSIIARTRYTTAKANPLGEQIYNYRLEEMPIGESIGFVPIEWVEPHDKTWGKHFDQWLDRYKQFMKLHQRDVPDDVELDRIFTLWIMLEYSDVVIPSNPFAIQNAVEKGLISEKDMNRYIVKTQPGVITKPETTENYHRVPVPGRECRITATITISASQGIKALYCGKEKKVATYLFDVNKWTMAEAKKWVAEHDSGKQATLFASKDIDSPERWNKALPVAFDAKEPEEIPTSFVNGIIKSYLGCDIKDVFLNIFAIPSPLIGSYLSAFKTILADYRQTDIRNFQENGTEAPPRYGVIQLNSEISDDFLIEGMVFYEGLSEKFILEYYPTWSSLNVNIITTHDQKNWNKGLLDTIHAWVKENNYLKNEKFALSGEFLNTTDEAWDSLITKDKEKVKVQQVQSTLDKKKAAMPSRGMIFMGPPGTGKTKTGRILMNDSNTTFIWVSSKDFDRHRPEYVLSLSFDMARDLAPSILFIEDIDSWLGGYCTDLLKTELDGIRQNKGLLTILTSNYPEKMPDALLDRPGRFHHIIDFALPDSGQRSQLLKQLCPELDNIMVNEVAKKTDGLSHAHIKEIVDYAAIIADVQGITLTEAIRISLKNIFEQRELIESIRAREKAFNLDIIAKAVIPYRDLGKADENVSWDGPAEVAAAEVSDLKLMCAWVDSANADVKSAYKLPHHKASGHAAVWRGVAAAMAALLGARGGTKIPPGDRKSVFSHLSRHYSDFGKESPEFKQYSEAAVKCISWYNGSYDDVDGFYEIEDDNELDSWHDTLKALENMKKETDIAALQAQIAEMQGQMNEILARLTPAETPDEEEEEEEPEEEEIDLTEILAEVFGEDADEELDGEPHILTAEERIAKMQGKVIQK